DVTGLKLNDIFEIKSPASEGLSATSFFEEKEMEGQLKNAEGLARPVKLLLKPMNIGGEFYQLLSVDTKAQQDQGAPKGRSDEERFSTESVLHLASHDLREPVRTILNYVQLIAENLKNKKYDAAEEYTGFARDAADGMERLLTDLKVYIGLSDHNFSLSRISMKLLVADVLKQMKDEIARTGAEVNVAQLPDINGDRDLVEKLVTQLIDNALKFYKKNTKPVVDIGFDKFEGKILFCVRDNGLGISKKYQDKIFELFERLNRVDEYRGNGLGLSISKKIVELHGGTMWVESLPGFGSSFYFTLGQG
ncbi:MAG: putative Histidine kinase, partial [Bacteroidota bacterium]|nr:putative Histidine kinase [Bacteroidota bacterium]